MNAVQGDDDELQNVLQVSQRVGRVAVTLTTTMVEEVVSVVAVGVSEDVVEVSLIVTGSAGSIL